MQYCSTPRPCASSPMHSRTAPRPPARHTPRRSACSPALARRAVELLDVELEHVDTIEATRVDRDHRRSLRLLAARERLDPALLAEVMHDDVLVDRVLGQLILAGLLLELVGGQEGEQRPALAADRAVARDELAEVEFDGVRHGAAVARTVVVGHPRVIPRSAEVRCVPPPRPNRPPAKTTPPKTTPHNP